MTAVLTPARPATDDDVRTSLLSAVVADIAADTALWRPEVTFRAEQRWWTRLQGPPGVDVWLLSWLQSQQTELHDHGEAAAAFTVVAGTLTEERFTDGVLSRRAVGVGQIQTVLPGVVHDVDNRDPEPAISIHAYSPRLTAMTYYERSGAGILPVRTVVTDEPEGAR